MVNIGEVSIGGAVVNGMPGESGESENKAGNGAIEKKFRQLFSTMNEGVATHDLVYDDSGQAIDYIITDVNPAFESILGLQRNEVIGKRATILYRASEAPYLDIYARIAATGETTSFETCFAPMDKYFRISVISIGPGKFATIFSDISEQKRSEERLAYLASYPELNPMLIMEIDPVCRVSYLNSAAKETFPDIEEKGPNHPFLKGISPLIDTLPEKSGRLIKREITVNSITYEQNIYWVKESRCARIYSSDVSDRKKDEEELHRLNRELQAINSCHQAIIRADNEQVLLKEICRIICESAGYRMAWVGLKEFDSKRSLRPVAWGGEENGYLATADITWDDTERGNGAAGLAARTGKTHFCQDFAADLKSAPWRGSALAHGFRSSIAMPLTDNDGVVFGVFSLYASQPNDFNRYEVQLLERLAGDLSFGINALRTRAERDQAEDVLKQRTADLEASNKELESFSYSVSHDLRAPLRSMDGFAEFILEDYGDKLDAVGKEYLQKIRSSSQLMAELIDDILTLSKVARTTMSWEKADLSRMAEEVSIELQRAHPGQPVEFKIQPGLEALGDSKLLKLVLDNLLGNALKFSSRTSHPRIEFGAKTEDGQTIYFVRDNGAGFEMEYVDKLFQPFQRLHSTGEFPGTGIGLASVQRIIRRHGGRAWAEGRKGEGATFYFTLNQKNE